MTTSTVPVWFWELVRNLPHILMNFCNIRVRGRQSVDMLHKVTDESTPTNADRFDRFGSFVLSKMCCEAIEEVDMNQETSMHVIPLLILYLKVCQHNRHTSFVVCTSTLCTLSNMQYSM